ncbi:MAG TPA: RNA 2',3'-cyclic phosphodiesterase [Candidatus Acidoferrum sp.]|nr:RNA 2',3'-cyclic phosphodiesterase [Candidatus Acidoferrum sp.]
MRLFVALEIPSAVRENLATLLASMRAITKEPRWVRAENLHVTLKFLGEVAEGKGDAVRSALGKIRSDNAVSMEFHRLGFFPNEKHPRVFWAGMEASSNLKTLAGDIETAIEKLGIPREKREFAPHLTLARFERPRLPEALRELIAENQQRAFGSLHTNQFHLIQSKLKPTGAEYTTLATFQFAQMRNKIA